MNFIFRLLAAAAAAATAKHERHILLQQTRIDRKTQGRRNITARIFKNC